MDFLDGVLQYVSRFRSKPIPKQAAFLGILSAAMGVERGMESLVF